MTPTTDTPSPQQQVTAGCGTAAAGPYGVHWVLDLYDCDARRLDDRQTALEALVAAAAVMKLTVLQTASHAFEPQGITALALLSESHLAVHTWPEHRYAAIDLFSCGPSDDWPAAVDLLVSSFGAESHESLQIARGLRGGLRGGLDPRTHPLDSRIRKSQRVPDGD